MAAVSQTVSISNNFKRNEFNKMYCDSQYHLVVLVADEMSAAYCLISYIAMNMRKHVSCVTRSYSC